MIEFEVGGHTYRSKKMPARTQYHVVRRMAPIMGPLQVLTGGGAASADAITALATAIGSLSDEAADYIIDRCMETVDRRQGETLWAPVKPPSVTTFMFQDMDMLAMLQIVSHVMRDNYTALFQGGLSGLTGGASLST